MVANRTEADDIRTWLRTAFTHPMNAAKAAKELDWMTVKQLENHRWSACYMEFSEVWSGRLWANGAPWRRK